LFVFAVLKTCILSEPKNVERLMAKIYKLIITFPGKTIKLDGIIYSNISKLTFSQTARISHQKRRRERKI